METITDIYSEAIASLPMDDIDHHASDLYLKVTPESSALIERYQWKCNVTRFNSAIDDSLWFDVPFAYSPAWPGSTAPKHETSYQYALRILGQS